MGVFYCSLQANPLKKIANKLNKLKKCILNLITQELELLILINQEKQTNVRQKI